MLSHEQSLGRYPAWISQYLGFLGISLLVICTPGQDTALTIRNTLVGGRRAGVLTAVGVAAGQVTWTVATSAGLAVVLVSSGPLFVAIRLAGAAYLVYLGVRSLARALRDDDRGRGGAAEVDGRRSGPANAFWQGLLSNLSNAKMVAFFVSLLPQFAGAHPSFALLLGLGLNFSLLTLCWLTAYAFAVNRVGGVLRRSRIRRAMDAALGAVLVGLGLRVAVEAPA